MTTTFDYTVLVTKFSGTLSIVKFLWENKSSQTMIISTSFTLGFLTSLALVQLFSTPQKSNFSGPAMK